MMMWVTQQASSTFGKGVQTKKLVDTSYLPTDHCNKLSSFASSIRKADRLEWQPFGSSTTLSIWGWVQMGRKWLKALWCVSCLMVKRMSTACIKTLVWICKFRAVKGHCSKLSEQPYQLFGRLVKNNPEDSGPGNCLPVYYFWNGSRRLFLLPENHKIL